MRLWKCHWYACAPGLIGLLLTIRTALLAVSPWYLALWSILFLCNERGWLPVLLSFHLPGHGTQENWTIILQMFPAQGREKDRHMSGKVSRLQSSGILVFQLLEFKRTPKPCLCSLLDQNLHVRGVCPASYSLNVFSHTVLEVSAVSPSPFTVSPSCSLWSYATNISEAVCLSALCFFLSL